MVGRLILLHRRAILLLGKRWVVTLPGGRVLAYISGRDRRRLVGVGTWIGLPKVGYPIERRLSSAERNPPGHRDENDHRQRQHFQEDQGAGTTAAAVARVVIGGGTGVGHPV